MTDPTTEHAAPEPGADPDPEKQRLALLAVMAKTGIKMAQVARESKVPHPELSKLYNHGEPLSPRDSNRLAAWLRVPAHELVLPDPPPPVPPQATRPAATVAA